MLYGGCPARNLHVHIGVIGAWLHCVPAPPPQVGAAQVRPALTLVGFEEELRPAMAYVFGSTFVCDTLETAKRVTFDKQVMTRSVALAGDVFDPSGTLTGG